VNRKLAVFGWAMYDFANSAFATTVLAVVFIDYFRRAVVEGGGVRLAGFTVPAHSLWLYVYAGAMLLVVVTGPVLGALADASARRKLCLAVCCAAGAAATCLMALVVPGDVLLALALLVVSAYAFSAGNIFYNSFLPDVAEPRRLGRVSGLGWGLGYLGGVLCLLVNLMMIEHPRRFGIPDVNHLPVRLSVLVAGVWWLVFALPMFAWVRERRADGPGSRAPLGRGLGQIARTLTHLRRHRTLFLFVLAFLLYSNGVEAVLSAGVLFGGHDLGMEQKELVECFLMIQVVALAGSFAFGWVADRVGSKRAVLGSLAVWLGVLVWAFFVRSAAEFRVMGAIIGLVMGGTQAASRSLMGMMTPAAHKAEFFGFYAFGGRMGAAVGPLVCAVVGHATGSMRTAVTSLLFFFAAGAVLLALVNVKRGLAEKEAADALIRPGSPAECADGGG
jgi:UMF1 family MFS transporter